VEHATAALGILPGYAEAAMVLAEGMLTLGRTEQALATLVDQLEYDSRNLPAILRLGEILQDTSRPTEARVAFRRVLRVDPGSEKAWIQLADSFAVVGRDAEANSCLARAVAIREVSQSLDHPAESISESFSAGSPPSAAHLNPTT
jgi:tetratricopeptide (TPR) repeat protein